MIRSLPLLEWPVRDRAAWLRAVQPTADPFADAPKLGSWAPRTQHQTRLALGRLMRWLMDHGHSIDTVGTAKALTEPLFLRFLEHELERQKVSTLQNEAFNLVAGLNAIAPSIDTSWTKPYLRRLARRARKEGVGPRRIAHSRSLYAIGLEEMAAAVADSQDPEDYRNGLCVALLSAIPIRIKNFSSLEIGPHLQRDAEGWRLDLSAAETKTRRSDSWPLPRRLVQPLENYLSTVRPYLLDRAGTHETPRLWIGATGHPVSDQMVRKWIKLVTAKHLGHAILPHSFRHSAATTFTSERPSKTIDAAALLGHASAETTERHYILHQRATSVSRYHAILDEKKHK